MFLEYCGGAAGFSQVGIFSGAVVMSGTVMLPLGKHTYIVVDHPLVADSAISWLFHCLCVCISNDTFEIHLNGVVSLLVCLRF